jgi:catechol 2,3-dioxygenase-like lactoylglutathione lyase family enzyme
MITALDHIALAVSQLDPAVEAYQRLLGREPNWIGGDGGARHAWFQLENMALDVITPHGEGAFGDIIRDHLHQHGEGVWAVAFTVDDAASAQRLAERRGLRTSLPGPTRSTHLDGRKRYWTTAAIEARDTAGVRILLVDPPRSGEPWPLSAVIGAPASAVQALDHLVIHTPDPERALAIYGAKLGLDLRLDRVTPAWGVRQLFFRCGDAVVEFAAAIDAPRSGEDDRVGGLAWRVGDAAATKARLQAVEFEVSPVRQGRKPGSMVLTVRAGVVGAPALLIAQEPRGSAPDRLTLAELALHPGA